MQYLLLFDIWDYNVEMGGLLGKAILMLLVVLVIRAVIKKVKN